eukprot:815310-Prorocentrum_minimum.AAC.1
MKSALGKRRKMASMAVAAARCLASFLLRAVLHPEAYREPEERTFAVTSNPRPTYYRQRRAQRGSRGGLEGV